MRQGILTVAVGHVVVYLISEHVEGVTVSIVEMV